MTAPSLRGRLRGLILGMLALVLVPLGVYSFVRTIHEIDELSDGRLAQSARTIQVLVDHAGLDAVRQADGSDLVVPVGRGPGPVAAVYGHTYESEVGFQVYGRDGRLLLSTANLAGLPPPTATDVGFRNVHHGGHRWRLFTQPAQAGGLLIRAGERYDSRHDILHALWIEHGVPPLVVLPLLAVLVGWAVHRGLRPLHRLAAQLDQRRPGSHEPVRLPDVPRELQPLLRALNQQFSQLEDALERERRFSADVAHELRTPIAAAMLDLENAAALRDPDEVRTALHDARSGLERLARRVEQLLALARLESGSATQTPASVDLVGVAKTAVHELAPRIAESDVDLEVALAAEPVHVRGHEAALGALLRNLLENALRHVPSGGRVRLTVGTDADAARIEVIDDGEGIPPERRQAVFARFHREAGSRGEGYGLGLSIVQRVAQWHGARIELTDSPFGRGLRVRVTLPLEHSSEPAR